MQSLKRAVKRGNAVVYNTGNGLDVKRKKASTKEGWKFAKLHKVEIDLK